MKMKFYLLSLVLGFFLSKSLVASDGYRSFTNANGDTIRAVIVNTRGDNITIRREDGASFTFPVTMLSAADQLYVEDWRIKQQIADPRLLRISISRRITNRTTNTYSYGVASIDHCQVDIDLENQTQVDLSDLRLEYRVYLTRAGLNQERQNRNVILVEGNSTVKLLERRESERFATRGFNLQSFRLNPGWRYRDHNQRGYRQDYVGTWVRVFYKGELVREELTNSSLPRYRAWPKK